jgi:hypothetical protein
MQKGAAVNQASSQRLNLLGEAQKKRSINAKLKCRKSNVIHGRHHANLFN